MDIDEVLWGEFANSVLKGCAPYVCVIGEKPPLLYLFYTAVFSLFGRNNYFALHLIHIFWVSGTAFLLNQIIPRKGGMFPGIFYLLLLGLPGFRMLAATGESLMNPFLVLSWILFLQFLKNHSLRSLVLVGVVVALASLFRHQAAIQIFFYAGWLLFTPRTKKNTPLLGLVAGFVGVWLLTYLLLIWWGAWEGYRYWGFAYSLGYIEKGIVGPGVWKSGLINLMELFKTTFVFWLLLKPAWSLTARSDKGVEFGYLLTALFAVTTGFRFYPHYFIQAFPPLAFLAATGLMKLAKNPSLRYWYRGAIVGVILSFGEILVQNVQASAQMAGDKDYARLNQIIGDYVRARTKPGETISIWGWGTGIYYYADRGMGTRFIHSDFLSGRVSNSDPRQYTLELATKFIVPGSWGLFLSDLEKNRPVYFVDSGPAKVHDYEYFPINQYPLLDNYLQRHYQLEQEIEGALLYRIREDSFGESW